MFVCDARAAVFRSGRHTSDKHYPLISRNEVVYVWAVEMNAESMVCEGSLIMW